MKICCTCKHELDEINFHKNKPSCKDCRKLERKRSYEKRKASDYLNILEYNRQWVEKNPEKNREHKKRWNQLNVDKCRIICNKRYSYAKQSRPEWANKFFIEEAYELAQRRSKLFKTRWEVDHIIPIKGKDVCGLHVETNLQVLPRSINASKQNRYTKQYRWSEFFQESGMA